MNTTTLTPEQALAEYNRLRDAARQRAIDLRREAVDGFFDAAGDAARRAARAAARLLARKARHQRLRTSLEV
jgi:hypothetical protein